MSKTICVTGGAGFIGSHLVDAFLDAGHRVVVLDDLSTGHRDNLAAGADFHEVDIRSEAAAKVVESADVLVHQAAQMNVRRSVDDPVFDAEVNILGTLNLLEAARRGRVEQVLFASTGGAIYGEQDTFPATEDHPCRPVSPYGVAKLACERYLYFHHVSHGLNVTCLRYANVYGPRQNPLGEAGVVAIFAERLLAGQTPKINGDGLQTRDYIYVGDVVRANLAALGRPGFHTYNVGTGIETNVVDLYHQLRAALGATQDAEHGPGKPGEQRRSVIDPSSLRRELGVPEPVAFDEGLRQTAAWFRGRG